MFYTYIYHDPERKVPMYVGKGKDKRVNFHLTKATNLRFKNRLITLERLGFSPIIEVIEMHDEDAALEEEIRLIAKFGRLDLDQGTLYNSTDGGEGKVGYITSEETKIKIGDANRNPSEETRQKQSSWVRGEGLRTKISAAQTLHRSTMTEAQCKEHAQVRSKEHLRNETRAMMSVSARSRDKVKCPHCQRVGGMPGMGKHHFDRCKHR